MTYFFDRHFKDICILFKFTLYLYPFFSFLMTAFDFLMLPFTAAIFTIIRIIVLQTLWTIFSFFPLFLTTAIIIKGGYVSVLKMLWTTFSFSPPFLLFGDDSNAKPGLWSPGPCATPPPSWKLR